MIKHFSIVRIATLISVWLFFAGPVYAAALGPMETREEWTSYKNGKAGLDIPALIVSPSVKGKYPGVLYIHGRWGLTREIVAHMHTLAQRGIVVMAPDYFFARAIPTLSWGTDSEVHEDVQASVPYFQGWLTAAGMDVNKVTILAQDHGGYHAIKLAEKYTDTVGALIGYYPLTNDPVQPKARHLYAYMAEVDAIKAPTLFMIGEDDREMRRISTKRVIERLRDLKRDATLIVYPGATRCFDWRHEGAGLMDGLAKADSINQIVGFIKQHVGGTGLLVLKPEGWRVI